MEVTSEHTSSKSARLFQNLELWQKFFLYHDELTNITQPPEAGTMSSTKASHSTPVETLTEEDQEETIKYLLDLSIESILHNVLLEVHREEKVARMQTAVVELEQRAEKLGKKLDSDTADDRPGDNQEPVETKAAVLKSGNIQLKGNPMKTVKQIRCPNCRLPRLLYPRVGFNSRPVPDPNQQYCKAEPMIIIDKHDVHGQRKKGVKVKGQPKGKNKKKADAASPAASENSDPLTPSSSMPGDSFEFKEIDYPAAKCPNRDSHLGDHWKSVNVFATHLNGSCFLKKDRAAGREANAKIGGTPRDSRANSPKPAAANGVKRKERDEEPVATTKKKQKTSDGKKNAKGAVGAPSKLKETTHVDEKSADDSIKAEANGDTIQVTPKGRDGSSEPAVKLKFSGVGGGSTARKKPGKPTKKS